MIKPAPFQEGSAVSRAIRGRVVQTLFILLLLITSVMSSGFVEESELERGIKTSQVPPVVAEAVIPEHGQTSIGRESEDKSSTISTSAVDEDDIDVGQ